MKKIYVLNSSHFNMLLSLSFENCLTIPQVTPNSIYQGIGNGLPLGAVVTTPEIARVMAQKIQFNTFGGNPVCSAGGLEVLRVIDQEKRQEHCAAVGSHLIGRLRELQRSHDSNLS
jgi:alanine-glyoxylate transaminase/(R)-3-amino-2-methylpropionate-pyruvate transaminase